MDIFFKSLFFASLLLTPCFAGPGDYAGPEIETKFPGFWKLDSPNAGVAAMQMQLMPNGKLVWFDTTALGDSAIKLNPPGNCPMNFEKTYADCFAHAIMYDPKNANVRPLRIESDAWCSSGGLAPNGDLVNTGGFNKGIRAVRVLKPCDTCEFQEKNIALSGDRWYSSNQILEDGSFIVVGGRRAYNYEIIPGQLEFPINQYGFPFLMETTDIVENNLFPFVYLMPTSEVFVFANDKAVLINPRTGQITKKLPDLPGGSRNYPASGQSVLLPVELDPALQNTDTTPVEVIVCGGNSHDAFSAVDGKPIPQKMFKPALTSCGRIEPLKQGSNWQMEEMPSPRVMGDMITLPNAHVLLINGAKAGTAGWWDADIANFVPAYYKPKKPAGQRFQELAPTAIARMYHSAAALLPCGRILLAGSNPNDRYNFQMKYPTELRVEKFDPPYLDPALNEFRPEIVPPTPQLMLKYGTKFTVQIKIKTPNVQPQDLKVTMYFPPFTTHGWSQNQRLLVLPVEGFANNQMTATAPANGKLAPPGYYVMYVVHRAVPSEGIWVTIG
ncbi:hypothetical protein LguiA_020001 [Lonicera macranthoides]